MNSRERVIKALNFEPVDKLPKDLGAMRSTGISNFAYPKLVKALGLPERKPKVHDYWQMLALPDMDVLDALGCDVVTIDSEVTNAFYEPQKWNDYDFNGRLEAKVLKSNSFEILEDGTIVETNSNYQMPPASYVFNEEHSGQPLDLMGELPLMDLKKYKLELEQEKLKDEDIERIAGYCKKVRQATDKAVFFSDHFMSRLAITGFGGIGVFPIICLTEPSYVQDLHGITIEHVLSDAKLLLPQIKNNVDIIMTGCDDWGTQKSLMIRPSDTRPMRSMGEAPGTSEKRSRTGRGSPSGKSRTVRISGCCQTSSSSRGSTL